MATLSNLNAVLMQGVPGNQTCSICKNPPTDPLSFPCGHSFCMPCFCFLWKEIQACTCCAVCRSFSLQMYSKEVSFTREKFFPAERPVACQSANTANLHCSTHQATKNLFCENDCILLCFLCSQSSRHATHGHSPLNQAAENYREYFLIQIKLIWIKKLKTQKSTSRAINILRSWEGFISLRKTMIQAEYPKLCQYLHEEKQKHLQLLEIEGKTIYQGLEKNISEMTNVGKLLHELYDELKEICQKTDEDLLQDLGHLLKKWESASLDIPQALEPQLSEKPISGLLERLRSFQVYIALNPNRSNYRMPLFEELKHLQYDLNHPDTLYNLASLEYTLSWGKHAFISGKHYWEVDVSNCCNWVIGFCSEPWTHRDDIRLNSKDIFLLLSVKVGGSCSLFSTSPLSPHYIQRPHGLVGIFLDYEYGVISFFNMATCSLICNFLPGSFSLPLRPFICYGSI